jgi:hypothetical protein
MASWEDMGLTTDQLENALSKLLPTLQYQVVSADKLEEAMKSSTYPKAIICNTDPHPLPGKFTIGRRLTHNTDKCFIFRSALGRLLST